MVEATLERVRRVLSLPGITPAGLAKRAKLHPNSLYSARSDEWNPSAKTLRALEPILGEIEGESGIQHGSIDRAEADAPSSGSAGEVSAPDEAEAA